MESFLPRVPCQQTELSFSCKCSALLDHKPVFPVNQSLNAKPTLDFMCNSLIFLSKVRYAALANQALFLPCCFQHSVKLTVVQNPQGRRLRCLGGTVLP